MSSVAFWPRLACVASSSAAARTAQADLAARYDLVDPDDCDVIVALGGDGLLLHTIHERLQLGRVLLPPGHLAGLTATSQVLGSAVAVCDDARCGWRPESLTGCPERPCTGSIWHTTHDARVALLLSAWRGGAGAMTDCS
jgi:hypothetical protein